MNKSEPMTKRGAAQALLDARMDIARLISNRHAELDILRDQLSINGQLYESITGEEAPPVVHNVKVSA